ncbi:MAG: hypothetical protein H6R34_649, partial [Bacteroidetes bacterium]|nr:hypothetical protein [Bacteroidota bacterium]
GTNFISLTGQGTEATWKILPILDFINPDILPGFSMVWILAMGLFGRQSPIRRRLWETGLYQKKGGALYCPLTHRKPKTKPMKKLPFLCDPSFQQYDISHEGFTYRGF